MANEKRLIDANRFLRETRFQEGVYPHKTLKMEIEEQPTVDAVPVVRCKDCRHCTKDENIIGAYGYCYHFGCYAHEPMVEADDFCSYGERREGE